MKLKLRGHLLSTGAGFFSPSMSLWVPLQSVAVIANRDDL